MESTNKRRKIQRGIAYFTIFEAVIWFLLVVIVQFGVYMPHKAKIVDCHERTHNFQIISYPQLFYAFLWIYTILYFFWFFWSFFVITVSKDDESEQKKVLKTWCCLTLLVSFVDVCASVYFGVVYDRCITDGSTINTWCPKFHLHAQKVCFTEILPMFLITGKCFVFWFANVMFATMIITMITRLNKQPPQPQQVSARVTIEVPNTVRPEDDLPPSYEVAVAMGRYGEVPPATKNG